MLTTQVTIKPNCEFAITYHTQAVHIGSIISAGLRVQICSSTDKHSHQCIGANSSTDKHSHKCIGANVSLQGSRFRPAAVLTILFRIKGML